MPRYPSDRSIRRRAVIAYHRAQALSRNLEYQKDIETLRSLKLHFDSNSEGVAYPSFPTGKALALMKIVCRRAGLVRPMLPEALRRLTVDRIAAYDQGQIFEDVPGWDVRPKKEGNVWEDFINARGARALFRRIPVPMKPLGRRHRAVADDTASGYWRVWDLWVAGAREREILQTMWPAEPSRRKVSTEKDAIRQRVYGHLKGAKRLIRLAYPPDPVTRTGPVCAWCGAPFTPPTPRHRYHTSRCATHARAHKRRMRAKTLRDTVKAEAWVRVFLRASGGARNQAPGNRPRLHRRKAVSSKRPVR